MRKIFILLSLVIIASCRNSNTIDNKEQNNVVEINVSNALKDIDTRKMEDIVESVQIIPLETKDTSLVSEPLKIICANKHIYILDIYNSSGGVIIFDMNGKFIKRFERGNGPKEILGADDIFFDYEKNEFYIHFANMLYKYTPDGDFICSITSEEYFSKIVKDKNNYIYVQNSKLSEDENFCVIKADSAFSTLQKTSLSKIQAELLCDHIVKSSDNDYYITRALDNYIYGIQNNSEKKYKLEFSDVEFNPSDYTDFLDIVMNMDEDQYVYDGTFTESNDYIRLGFASKKYKRKYVYYHKKSGKIWSKQFVKKSFYNIVSGDCAIHNKKNTFFGVIIPERIFGDNDWRWDGKNPNNLLSDNDMKILKNAKEDDNPIIVIYKLKDEI